MFYAVAGRTNAAIDCLYIIEEEVPQIADEIRKTVSKIIAGKHPQMHELPVIKEKITSFRQWFSTEEEKISNLIKDEEYDELSVMLNDRLKEAFPFMEGTLQFVCGEDGNIPEIIFADLYSVSLRCGYENSYQNVTMN